MNTDLAHQARASRKFLDNLLKQFPPDSADFRPHEGAFTVSQQIRHIARTIHWFQEGIFDGTFRMDFEAMEKELATPCSLADARAELDQAWDEWIARIESATGKELQEKLPPNPILGEMPRWLALQSNVDHVAHHRGSLAVYLRLLGVVPEMIYVC
ncbi:MAG: hypothetical protein PWP23_1646 [Candidatus Sumerlaeota bacterium]|nr:hypothetical protein [Candidatus Sumerlaeota bacterium]